MPSERADNYVERGIRKLRPGVFQVRVGVGRDKDSGKVIQTSQVVYGGIREARAARDALAVNARRVESPTRSTVAELGRRWLADIQRRGRSPNTVYGYRKKWAHIDRALGPKPVAKVTTTMLNTLYADMASDGHSAANIGHVHEVARAAFNEAIRWGWIRDNPVAWARPPEVRRKKTPPPPPEVVRALLAETSKEANGPEMSRLWFTAATTGCRRAELCAIRWPDVDWTTGTLHICRTVVDLPGEPWSIREYTKNYEDRDVELDGPTMALLGDQRAVQERRALELEGELDLEGFAFSDDMGVTPWLPDRVTHAFDRARTRLGLDGKRVKFHSLRKFMVTHALDAGIAIPTVAERAGHGAEVMLRVYGSGTRASNRRAGEVAAALLAAEEED